jgi:hypothetical protein
MRHLTADEIAEFCVDLDGALVKLLRKRAAPHEAANELCPVCYGKAELLALLNVFINVAAYVISQTDAADADESQARLLKTFEEKLIARVAADRAATALLAKGTLVKGTHRSTVH